MHEASHWKCQCRILIARTSGHGKKMRRPRSQLAGNMTGHLALIRGNESHIGGSNLVFLVFFFVVWIVVTVSVTGQSQMYMYIYIYIYTIIIYIYVCVCHDVVGFFFPDWPRLQPQAIPLLNPCRGCTFLWETRFTISSLWYNNRNYPLGQISLGSPKHATAMHLSIHFTVWKPWTDLYWNS